MRMLLNDKILKQTKYNKVDKLNARENKKIKDVTHLTSTLKKLNASGYCGIDQDCIQKLNLIELDAAYNEKIKDVSHMSSTLKILNASYKCGIDQKCINNLCLTELDASDNKKIKDVEKLCKA